MSKIKVFQFQKLRFTDEWLNESDQAAVRAIQKMIGIDMKENNEQVKKEKYGYKIASKKDIKLNKDPEIIQKVLDTYHEIEARMLEEADDINWPTFSAIIPFATEYGFVKAYYDVREQIVEKISWSVFLGLDENDAPLYCPYEVIF